MAGSFTTTTRPSIPLAVLAPRGSLAARDLRKLMCEEAAGKYGLLAGHCRIRRKIRMMYQNIKAIDENSASAAATCCRGS